MSEPGAITIRAEEDDHEFIMKAPLPLEDEDKEDWLELWYQHGLGIYAATKRLRRSLEKETPKQP